VLFYVAIVLALTLAAAGAVLCFYVVMLEQAGRRLRRRVEELERENAALRAELERGREDGGREWWPEVLDEGDGLTLN
jgi:hypothetical protein